MHPRNRYNTKPDFGELAEFRPSLKPYLIHKSKSTHTADDPAPSLEGISPGKSPTEKRFPYTLDFSDPASLRELTCAVLARDFSLDVDIPLDKLIPAVPQRLNYIHWVEDLLGLCGGVKMSCESVETSGMGVEMSCESVETNGVGVEMSCESVETIGVGVEMSCEGVETSSTTDVIGIDIGTGASCIYPLLGTRLNGWSFLATDIDQDSVAIATENVARNGLTHKVKVVAVTPEVVLMEAMDPAVSQYTFCMCNPPFFKDTEERLVGVATHSGRRPPAETFSRASPGEAITQGGEVAFTRRIIQDSLQLKNRVRWYTTMLGKKSSLKPLLAQLKQNSVPVVTSTEFVQGRTWRWGLGWSFDLSLKEKVAALNTSNRKRREKPLCLRQPLYGLFTSKPRGERTQLIKEWLVKQMKELAMKVTEEAGLDSTVRLRCHGIKNTWSHQRKRRRLIECLDRQRKEDKEAVIISSADGGTNEEAPIINENIRDSEHKALYELEALSTPCHVRFICSLVSGHEMEHSPKKKRKLSPNKAHKIVPSGKAASFDVEDKGLCVELEWVEGENKDTLHQILQYLNNKLSQQHF